MNSYIKPFLIFAFIDSLNCYHIFVVTLALTHKFPFFLPGSRRKIQKLRHLHTKKLNIGVHEFS